MWLTAAQEAWLRDSLKGEKGEPAWLQIMVLENFGIGVPDMMGNVSALLAMARLSALMAGDASPFLGVRPPRTPANDPFGNPRLDTTVE